MSSPTTDGGAEPDDAVNERPGSAAAAPRVEGFGEAELVAWLDAHGVVARLVVPGVPTPTVSAAAAALGVAVDAILKSLVFLVGGEPRLVVAAGQDRVRYPAVAALWGVSRRRVRLATPAEALAISGYAVGAMPPFGHRRRLPTVVDTRAVRPARTVYAGGGSRAALLELRTDELLRVTAAATTDLTHHPDGGDRP